MREEFVVQQLEGSDTSLMTAASCLLSNTSWLMPFHWLWLPNSSVFAVTQLTLSFTTQLLILFVSSHRQHFLPIALHCEFCWLSFSLFLFPLSFPSPTLLKIAMVGRNIRGQSIVSLPFQRPLSVSGCGVLNCLMLAQNPLCPQPRKLDSVGIGNGSK